MDLLITKHRRSFMTSRMAANTVLGALHRLAQTTAEDVHLLPDVYRLLWSLHNIGYTMRDFSSALRSLVRSDSSKWQPVQQHLHIHELLFRRNTTTIARFLNHATREV